MANKQSVRTSVDIPIALHRRLREAAARQGCSARQLILRSIEQTVEASEPTKPNQRLDLRNNPLIPSRGGEPFNLTNEEIYELIEFP
ncbi:MAG: hypothetical protein JNK87_30670 [Bryobacterales bacterium]|nr:hypothetical protein [Bryobacterales bacterium]